MTMLEIAWSAGFLEGEGYFAFKAHSGRPAGSTAGCLCIVVGQASQEPLVRLATLYGGTVNGPYNNGPGRKPIYTWNAFGSSAAATMMTVFSLMSKKRKTEIAGALSSWRLSPGRDGGWGQRRPTP